MEHHRPLILAHRGLVTAHQENTTAAVKAALESPYCNGCEFDVFLTKDGQVVLFHDESMKRLTGIDRSIYEMTWEELKNIPILPEIEVDGGLRKYQKEEKIPLLTEVLEEIRGKDFFVDIELKAYQPEWSKRHVGPAVAKIVRDLGMEEQVACTSFNFFMLYSLEREHPGIRSGFAYDDNMPLSARWLNRLMEMNIIGKLVHSNVLCSEHTLIDEDTITKYHSRGMRVGAFTLFPLTPEGMESERVSFFSQEMQRLSSLGIDWIETDDPKLAWDAIQA